MNYNRKISHDKNVEKYDTLAKLIMKSEMAKCDNSYENLSRMLNLNGSHYTATSLRLKVMRGKFSFSFFIECMNAMHVTSINFDDYNYEQSLTGG